MRSGGEKRGNSYDRAARKNYLLSPAAGFGGQWYYCGALVKCVHCPAYVGYADMQVDRIIPGSKGGRYTRDNIQPSCWTCNLARSDNENWSWSPS